MLSTDLLPIGALLPIGSLLLNVDRDPPTYGRPRVDRLPPIHWRLPAVHELAAASLCQRHRHQSVVVLVVNVAV